MAWTCSARTNQGLVNNLAHAGFIRSSNVIAAMKQTDRANYCVDPNYAYVDAPQPIGFKQTISAPHMHASALELAHDLGKDAHVLDVGAGSGYLSVCLARMVYPNGRVIGLECIPDLVELATKNTMKSDADLLNKGILHFRVGDGWNGAPDDAPFDYIHVGAAASEVPRALLRQLKDGGKLVIPVGARDEVQSLLEIVRDGSNFHEKHLLPVNYVPLVHPHTEEL